jgi:hypothetical protein
VPSTAQTSPNAAPSDTSPQAKKPWWRTAMVSPWTVAICAPLIVVAILAGIHFFSAKPAATGHALVLNGWVVCDSGRSVVGIWIAASSGGSDSGPANLGSSGSASRSHPGSAVSYTYLLRHGGTYSVHVGCGDTAAHWASTSYSPLISGATAHLHCRDPESKPIDGLTPNGHCAEGSA